MMDIFPAWYKILQGRRPFLSLEITRECPLRCPGCYAYMPDHLGATGPLRTLGDFSGQELVARVLALVKRLRPLHISIVGGDPLVRWRELDILLPNSPLWASRSRWSPAPFGLSRSSGAISAIFIWWSPSMACVPNTTSAARRPRMNASSNTLRGTASPCTARSPGRCCAGPITSRSLREFWSDRREVTKIWFSLFTPQQDEAGEERLSPRIASPFSSQLERLRGSFPKIYLPNAVLDGYRHPPDNPESCIFAQATSCVSCDLTTRISPCQFGGQPVCSECGCVASAGLASIGKHKLLSVLPVSDLFRVSKRAGERFDAWLSAREASSV